VTSWPCSTSSAAATALSTPPDIATSTRAISASRAAFGEHRTGPQAPTTSVSTSIARSTSASVVVQPS
jgi:hypothetical protein